MTKTESFQDRVKREKREEATRIKDFVAKLLTLSLPGWTPTVAKHADWDNPYGVHFDHETGARFFVTVPTGYQSRHGKVEAYAKWPDDADGDRKDARDWGLIRYGESDPHTIGFSYFKSAKAITSDLARRLVPRILESIAKVNAKLLAQKAEKVSIDVDVEALTAVLPNPTVREQSYYSAKLDFEGGHARLSNYNPEGKGNLVDLELKDLTTEQAVAVAKLFTSFDRD